MRSAVFGLSVVIGAVACGESRVEQERTIEPARAAEAPLPRPEPPSNAAEWEVRFVRACSTWAGAYAFATEQHVFGCDGAVFDRATGALMEAHPGRGAPVATTETHTLWREDEHVRVRDGALAPGASIAIDSLAVSTPRGASGPLLALTERGIEVLDPARGATRIVEGSADCADALAIGHTQTGTEQCIIRCGSRRREESCLVTVGATTSVELAPTREATWVGPGRVLALGWDDVVRLLDEQGAVLATRPAEDGFEIRDAALGSALVSRAETTELWRTAGDQLEVETVYGRRADEASFAGDEIVLVTGHSLFWLHRGPRRELPTLPPPATPAGYRALRAGIDDGMAAFLGGPEEVFSRGPNDVTAFVPTGAEGALVTVARGDTTELSRFTDDLAFAEAAAARYVEPGSERWARTWHGPEGRVVRGHAYIGGCERSHYGIELRERGGVLELWTIVGAEPDVMDQVLGAMPADARDVPGVRGDSYEGDPSTGRI